MIPRETRFLDVSTRIMVNKQENGFLTNSLDEFMMKQSYRSADQIWVRQHNLKIVLNCVWEAGAPISRAQVVEQSGLNKGTVGSLLTELQKWNLVKASGISNAHTGRPSTLVDIDPDGGRVIGVEIGVDSILVVLTDFKAQVIWSRKVEANGVSFVEN